jgi:hypothetical protein
VTRRVRVVPPPVRAGRRPHRLGAVEPDQLGVHVERDEQADRPLDRVAGGRAVEDRPFHPHDTGSNALLVVGERGEQEVGRGERVRLGCPRREREAGEQQDARGHNASGVALRRD